MKNILLALLVTAATVFHACTYDELAEPEPVAVEFCDTIPTSYDLNIRLLIDESCAYTPSCHGAGSGIGDYTSYATLLPYLQDGSFEDRVITQKDDPIVGMPPAYASGPQDLTDTQLDQITCWLEANYPEN